MNEVNCSESERSDLTTLLCGCGREVHYSHFKNGEEKMSCNKYAVCQTYAEQFETIKRLQIEATRYKNALQKINDVNGTDYEYKAWAKAALDT